MAEYQFKQNVRLRRSDEFQCVFNAGQRSFSRHFIIIFLPNNISKARLGIVVSKRKCRLSVHRNHLKRIIREYFRLNQHQLTGLDLVVLLKSPIDNSRDPVITKCLNKQFARLIAQHSGLSSS